MPEGESPSGPRFCRQCGAAVPEGSANCPRCGQRWYMDRVEQQGVDLWQKIIEKRAAAGLAETPPTAEKEYRCPNCMAVLKGPVAICPHCGKSTVKVKITPAADEADNEPIAGPGKLNLPASAKGLGTIKGAEQRARLFQRRSKLKILDIVIVVAIVLILAVIGYMVARQYGVLSPALDFFKLAAKPQQTVQTVKPDISDIAVSDINSTGATVAWSTSVKAYGNLLYGKTENYGMSSAANTEQAAQKVILSGLEPGSSYHFAVVATDNTSKELARSNDQVFNTPAQKNAKAPMVTAYKVTPTDIGAFISWTTDEPTTSQVLYGTNQQCTSSTPLDSKMVTNHSTRLSGLEVNTTYFYRIKSVNAAGNTAVMDPPNVFNTLITVPIGFKVGERASDFTLPIFKSQETISLRSYKGQKVLLTFWAVYCPECDRELALLQSLKNKNLPNVNIIAIFLESKLDDIEKTMIKYKTERGELTVPVIVDMYKTAGHLYNVEKLPCTFFIDGDGIIRDIEYGNFNIDQVEQTLKDL
jgi:peroxiredoxin/RNA polymerase subunit RPABC4/transcription elongation factor Spt4